MSHMHQVSVQLTYGWLGKTGRKPKRKADSQERGTAADVRQLGAAEKKIKKTGR